MAGYWVGRQAASGLPSAPVGETAPAPFTLRPYRGLDDIPGMTAALNEQEAEDGESELTTVASMRAQYQHLQRSDPDRDIVVAEAVAENGGRIVGYGRTMWDDLAEGFREHWLVVAADPKIGGLDAALLDWLVVRAQEVAAGHEGAPDRRLGAEADDESALQRLLDHRRFTPREYYAAMVRRHLDDIPDRALPDGVEIRPVEPAHLRAIWECDIEAFRDHAGYVEQTEEDWAKFRDEAAIDASLWQVAWSGDDVVGQVRTRSSAEEDERRGRRRGWTEDISTRREWRKQGIASALICASLRQLRQLGFDEAALFVDTDNPSRAYDVYLSLGYEIVKRGAIYERRI